MKNLYLLLISIFLLSITNACQTTSHTRRRTSNKTQKNNAKLNLKLQNIEKTTSNYDERISDLSFQLKQLIEVNNSLVKQVNSLTKRNQEISQQMAVLNQKTSRLSADIEEDKKKRAQENELLLKEIVSKTSNVVNSKINGLQQRINTSRTASRPTQSQLPQRLSGEYYEYKVQPGATLAAIAKAYKVRVSDIKKVNHLKSDIIRVGQKLYIPKK